ncbi:tetraacyldisaccharide 4'-kinase [Flavobacterium sp.]|jgi:tetraacyldisaccharide 4'-kinase|uniref:tetraacyldisaccharide 4'-kinase n=1 Tax=Flavobacterium sp. TaxID=239 RepID=UPI0022C87B1F|nr:tetraacyldisaccharide 4'-kinase [Flavobacterium sp.]MCZ8228324.1 tetraacyldisaccharide 4'-kinase [Flavobacterium sp.]
MKLLRILLFPFAVVYGFITTIRNFLFDIGFLKSYSFSIPIIAVGNLSVGGTGKTPQIEYLIRLFSSKYRVATLSRGYKRQSKGFLLADSSVNAAILGDEPFQFFKKFPVIQVAVDANRKNGIEQLLSQKSTPEIILLDDAYQHRKVKAGFYILLTAYGDLYANDFLLPAGNLRESRSGAQRAAIVVVTKCPKNLSMAEQISVKSQLKLAENQQLYFTFVDYEDSIYSKESKTKIIDLGNDSKLLLAGIAKPEPFFEYLKRENDICLTFPDHHHFSESEIVAIQKQAKGRKIITTEKDYVRLKDSILFEQLYYLPIRSSFINNEKEFDQTILNYVGTSSRNR